MHTKHGDFFRNFKIIFADFFGKGRGGCRIFDKIIIISFRKKLGLSPSLERVFFFSIL